MNILYNNFTKIPTYVAMNLIINKFEHRKADKLEQLQPIVCLNIIISRLKTIRQKYIVSQKNVSVKCMLYKYIDESINEFLVFDPPNKEKTNS